METQTPAKPKRKGKPKRHPRLRTLLKIAFGLVAIFAVIVAVQFLLPITHRGALLELLTPPEGCEAPCFMGIRPGETALEEAVAILEAHERVEEGAIYGSELDNQLYWRWSGLQPETIYREYPYPPARLYYDEQGVVSSILISTDIPFGVILLTLGYPAGHQQGGIWRDARMWEGIVIWPEYFIGVRFTECSPSLYAYWYDDVRIEFHAPESDYLHDYAGGYIPTINQCFYSTDLF